MGLFNKTKKANVSDLAKFRAAGYIERGESVYVHWNASGIPICPICNNKVDKNGKCPCGVPKKPDDKMKGYKQCAEMDFERFKAEAERANKRYEEKKRKEAEERQKAESAGGSDNQSTE